MKKYSLLLCFLATSFYTTVAQQWTKKYDRIDACNCGLSLVKKDGKFGYVNEQGKLMVPLIYEEGIAFSEERAAVSHCGKWGFVDKNGNEFVKPQYTEVYSFHEGLAVVSKGDEYGFIDSTGEVVIPLRYSNARSFADGIAPVCNKKGLWGYVDKNGKEVIAFRFNYANTFTDGVGRVLLSDKWCSIDKEGNLVKEVERID